jgi:hypothetical protein
LITCYRYCDKSTKFNVFMYFFSEKFHLNTYIDFKIQSIFMKIDFITFLRNMKLILKIFFVRSLIISIALMCNLYEKYCWITYWYSINIIFQFDLCAVNNIAHIFIVWLFGLIFMHFMIWCLCRMNTTLEGSLNEFELWRHNIDIINKLN